MSENKFIKSTSLYMLAILIPQVMGFIMLPIITRFLSPEEYGIYMYTSSVTAFIFVISALGLHAYYLREYYLCTNKKELNGSIYIFLIIFNSILLILGLYFGETIFNLLKIKINFNPYMKLALIGLYFSVFEIIPIRTFRIRKESNKYFWSIILRTFMIYLLNIVLVVVLKMGILGKYYADIISYAIFSIYYIGYMVKHSYININFNIIKSGIKFSKYIIPADLLQMLVNRGDRIIMEQILSLEKLGQYSIASTISSVSTSVSVSVYQSLEPDMFKNSQEKDFIDELKKIKTFFMLAIFIISAGIGFFSEEIIMILADKAYIESANIIKFLVLATPALALNQIVYMISLVEKKTFIKLVSYLVGAIFTILLNILIIPKVGVVGAGIVRIVSSFAILFTGFYFTETINFRNLKIKDEMKAYIVSIILLIIQINNTNFILSIFIKIICIIIYILILFKIYNIDIKNYIYKIVKR